MQPAACQLAAVARRTAADGARAAILAHPRLQILVVIFNIIWIGFVLDAEVEPATAAAGEEGKKCCKKGGEAATGDVEAGTSAAAQK